jgi:serine/threonine protein kinase
MWVRRCYQVIRLSVAETVRRQILLELRTLYQSQSPNIVKFYGAFFTEGQIQICLELMDGIIDRRAHTHIQGERQRQGRTGTAVPVTRPRTKGSGDLTSEDVSMLHVSCAIA